MIHGQKMACVFHQKLQVRPNVQLLRQGIPGEICGVAVACFFSKRVIFS